MNNDIRVRDKIIFGEYNHNKYSGGIRRTEVPASIIKELINKRFIDLNENQNESPTTKEFMDVISGYEDNVMFEIYTVDITRDDYRVTIEGIEIEIPVEDKDGLCLFVENFRYADEFNLWVSEDCYHIRAWWD